MADTFADTPPELKIALEGVARFSDTLNTRDAQLRNLLANANKVTAVLGKRSDQIAKLVVNANALLAELLTQRDSIDALMNNLTAVSHQISGPRRRQPHATQARAGQAQRRAGDPGQPQDRNCSAPCICSALRDVVRRGAGVRPVLQGLAGEPAPGQFAQPFIDAAFSDLGLDPNVLLPSQLVDPGVGQPGTPALPVPYPRTGQGGEPN